jgi:hypothetical protein
MKYCPNCQTTYTDDSLRFCLQDGTSLITYSGKSSQNRAQAFDETETVVRQNQAPSGWEQSQVTRVAALQPKVKKSNTPLIIILTALTMCVLFGGAAGIWLLLSGGSSEVKVPPNNNTYKSPSPSPTSIVKNDTGWEPIDNQASLNGTNLTYYRGTTAEQCQADCDKNPKCKAFTLIRAGAYNPNDTPMCYLAAEVTGSVFSTCCISGIKSESDDYNSNRIYTKETRKACDYFLSSELYDKWKQMGGKDGILGCPIINETEAGSSPQGTTGRMTQFSKGDGGYIIRHESGRFSGTAFEVSGCMFKIYASIGNTKSWLGFPIKDGYSTSTGARQDFESGYILWDSKTYNCQAYKN